MILALAKEKGLRFDSHMSSNISEIYDFRVISF